MVCSRLDINVMMLDDFTLKMNEVGPEILKLKTVKHSTGRTYKMFPCIVIDPGNVGHALLATWTKNRCDRIFSYKAIEDAFTIEVDDNGHISTELVNSDAVTERKLRNKAVRSRVVGQQRAAHGRLNAQGCSADDALLKAIGGRPTRFDSRSARRGFDPDRPMEGRTERDMKRMAMKVSNYYIRNHLKKDLSGLPM